MAASQSRRILVISGLTAVYFVAGRFGLSLAFINESASAVWPPTGIAIAALLLIGTYTWPAIAVGSFLVNLTTSGAAVSSAAIAAGNTIEGLTSAWLTRRFARGRSAFERPPDIVRFAILAAAEDANRVKERFVATLSHELRTPLNAALGWSRVLLDLPHNDGRFQRATQSIYRNLVMQGRLVADIIDVSRGEAGLDLQRAPVDVTSIVQASVDTVRNTAAARAIALETCLPATPIVIAGDAGRLQQVVWNLLENAIKFSPDGGVVRASILPADSFVDHRCRPGAGHRSGVPTLRIRRIPAGRRVDDAFARRTRARTRNRPTHRAAARRYHHVLEPTRRRRSLYGKATCEWSARVNG